MPIDIRNPSSLHMFSMDLALGQLVENINRHLCLFVYMCVSLSVRLPVYPFFQTLLLNYFKILLV